MPKVIVIDPGHGGSDPGASGHDIVEADFVLKMAVLVKSFLAEYDCQVLLTRSDDTYVSLADRPKLARAVGAKLFVSLHANAFGEARPRGFETFIHSSADIRAARAQKAIHEAIYEAIADRTPDRGMKRANYQVLRESGSIPAVLIEYGFLTNSDDAAYLGDDGIKRALARATATGIAAFAGLSRRVGRVAKWRVAVDGAQVGAYLDPARAVAEAVSSESARKIEITRI